LRRKLAPQIGNVGSRDGILKDFFDDRLEIGERADRAKGPDLRRAAGAAR
jgi:hypothetical protein